MKAEPEKLGNKRQRKKEKIFEAALKVFGKYGFKKATLEDIAAALNMSKSAFYRYFADKQDLYDQAVSYGLTRWQQTSLQSIEKEKDPLLQLKKYALTGVTYLNGDADFKRILLNDPAIFPLNSREDRFARINDESMNILKEILRRGVKTGRFRNINIEYATSFLYSVYIMFVIKSQVKADIEAVDDMIDASLDILLHGVVKP